MVEIFTSNINTSLDNVAPVKSFTVKSHYRFGLSEASKELMIKRDNARAAISKAGPSEKIVLLNKYKKLRNLVNSKIRAENIKFKLLLLLLPLLQSLGLRLAYGLVLASRAKSPSRSL